MRRSLGFVLALAVAFAATAPAVAKEPVKDVDIMQKMMERLDGYAKAGEAQKVGGMLFVIAAMQPRDKAFPQWAAIARNGSNAAKRGDMATAKAACTSCHDKYRDAYKAKYASKAPKPVD